MRSNIVKRAGRDLRQDYIQQYLKSFLRKVHPDLFQNHPKEQLQNSASLQDLLPLVGHENNRGATLRPSPAGTNSPTKLVFYLKPKNDQSSSPRSSNDPPKAPTLDPTASDLKFVEHTLPALDLQITMSSDGRSAKGEALEQEAKSWQMVQSFFDLCKKVDISVKDIDQQEVVQHLDQSIQEATTTTQSNRHRAPQKPLSEVFEEDLRNSFAESGIGVSDQAMNEDISSTHLDKIGGTATALDAQVMIKSNQLLFKSPKLSASRLSKVVRTWIHWQEEDQQLEGSLSNKQPSRTSFHIGDWWRKVPVMILSSEKERTEVSHGHNGQSIKGMLVVDQEMSKHDMTEYLSCNLKRIKDEYRDMLQAATLASSLSPLSHTRASDRPWEKGQQDISPHPTLPLSHEAASYLERMRTRAMLQSAKSRSKYNKRYQG
ncbi:hypothetical protein BC939DRAFT_73409 [Gamsiella multidivaricata]|uniref:uncharacterized protein n=1 Tax=Gamsiella multidivaricata TaxID=101098 RepID=UPI002220ADFC|nr:uncharacterized protein BC939DRAFT_73409 [Gamsiella multidivaricata]KAG0367671.1 hypothetical protein BGZ54_003467 [Gamsiella multidivaricata]KAI7815956.1 hypothetical protein BC939DRAFT_73409 [Gamsiella multidivaricata]